MRDVDLKVLNAIHQIAPASYHDVAAATGLSEPTARRAIIRLTCCGAVEFHSYRYKTEKTNIPSYLYAPRLHGPLPKYEKPPEVREKPLKQVRKRVKAESAPVWSRPTTDPWGRSIGGAAT